MQTVSIDVEHLKQVAAAHAARVDLDARFPLELVTALREQRLLSAYVPIAHGGLGLSLRAVSELCEALGRSCASSAMVFAMHQIQVACIVHHGHGAHPPPPATRQTAPPQRRPCAPRS